MLKRFMAYYKPHWKMFALDMVAALLNRTFRRRNPITTDFIYVFAAFYDELTDSTHRLVRSVSFGLLLLCAGLYATFLYLLK